MEPGLRWLLVGTVGSSNAVEAVTLHDTGEALALGGADDVDLLAGFEELDGELLAQLVSQSASAVRSSTTWRRGVTPAFSK